MSKVADSIRRGLREAVEYAEGKADASVYRISCVGEVDVKAIRTLPSHPHQRSSQRPD